MGRICFKFQSAGFYRNRGIPNKRINVINAGTDPVSGINGSIVYQIAMIGMIIICASVQAEIVAATKTRRMPLKMMHTIANPAFDRLSATSDALARNDEVNCRGKTGFFTNEMRPFLRLSVFTESALNEEYSDMPE